jgi:hypothetical protein
MVRKKGSRRRALLEPEVQNLLKWVQRLYQVGQISRQVDIVEKYMSSNSYKTVPSGDLAQIIEGKHSENS